MPFLSLLCPEVGKQFRAQEVLSSYLIFSPEVLGLVVLGHMLWCSVQGPHGPCLTVIEGVGEKQLCVAEAQTQQ